MAGSRVWLEVVNNAIVVRKQFVAPTIDADSTLRYPLARYQSEVRWLQHVAHPAAVNLIEVDTSSLILTTEFATSRTLADPFFTDHQIANGLALTCHALTQLHERGIAHGALRLSHVLFDSETVRLCGASGFANEPSVDANALAAMLRDIATLRSYSSEHYRGGARPLRLKGLRAKRESPLDWRAAADALEQAFSDRMPNVAQLAQVLNLRR